MCDRVKFLHVAQSRQLARNGDIAGVKALLAKGVDPNKRDNDGNTALVRAHMPRLWHAVSGRCACPAHAASRTAKCVD